MPRRGAGREERDVRRPSGRLVEVKVERTNEEYVPARNSRPRSTRPANANTLPLATTTKDNEPNRIAKTSFGSARVTSTGDLQPNQRAAIRWIRSSLALRLIRLRSSLRRFRCMDVSPDCCTDQSLVIPARGPALPATAGHPRDNPSSPSSPVVPVFPVVPRHSRESGNPDTFMIEVDSRFRGNDGVWQGVARCLGYGPPSRGGRAVVGMTGYRESDGVSRG